MTGLQLENYTISAQQRKYMKNERRNLYIALEELDMLWDEDEVAQLHLDHVAFFRQLRTHFHCCSML
ncbi:hypothetical protein ACT4US_30945, partial [Bacillus sp. HC-Mk]